MRSLLRLLIAVIVLGTATQQGWLQVGTRFAITALGGPEALAAAGSLDAMTLARSLLGALGTLPNPWYSLTVIIGSIIALVFLASMINGMTRAMARLTGWVRDVCV